MLVCATSGNVILVLLMENNHVDMDDIKLFLAQNIFSQPVMAIKKFGKGQVCVCYVKLSDGTELSVKFYKSVADALYAYQVAKSLEQNKVLKVPHLYELKDKYFQYKDYFGLCFYYIDGHEISTRKLGKRLLREIVDAYSAFKIPVGFKAALRTDVPIENYISSIRNDYLNISPNRGGGEVLESFYLR